MSSKSPWSLVNLSVGIAEKLRGVMIYNRLLCTKYVRLRYAENMNLIVKEGIPRIDHLEESCTLPPSQIVDPVRQT